MTGYLTYRGNPEGKNYQLAIPNMEIRNIFVEQILTMFREDVARDGEMQRAFCNALKKGEAQKVEQLLTDYMSRTVSVRDTFVRVPTKENFYHGMILGILSYKEGWYIKSNRESGDGYGDIFVRIENEEIGIIIEVKYAGSQSPDTVCRNALSQIETRNYKNELVEDGCHLILKYGIACCKKQCRVMVEKEEY